MCLFDGLVEKDVLGSPGRCPECGSWLHVDTGSILDCEEELAGDPVLFCTGCGYDSAVVSPPQATGSKLKGIRKG